jgi:uncharacterized protein (TIGR02271 family)
MANEEVEVIPLIEERLLTDKVRVETGRVRVRTEVDQRQEVVRDRLRRHHVDVQRVPRNIEVSEAPAARREGDITIIPVVEEVLVVQKKLMLVEELHVRQRITEEEIEQPVNLRVQRAVVERAGDSGEVMFNEERVL